MIGDWMGWDGMGWQMTVDPKKRLTIAECIQHPWISGGKASDAVIPGYGSHAAR